MLLLKHVKGKGEESSLLRNVSRLKRKCQALASNIWISKKNAQPGERGTEECY